MPKIIFYNTKTEKNLKPQLINHLLSSPAGFRSTSEMFTEFSSFISPSNGIIFSSQCGSISSGCIHLREGVRDGGREREIEKERGRHGGKMFLCMSVSLILPELSSVAVKYIFVSPFKERRSYCDASWSTVNKGNSEWLDFQNRLRRAACAVHTQHYSAWISYRGSIRDLARWRMMWRSV